MSRAVLCSALLGGLALTACVDELPLPAQSPGAPDQAADPQAAPGNVDRPAQPTTPPPATCATDTSIEQWTGTASRTSEQYPDDIMATVTWQRVAATGCTDRYVPSGQAHYRFAIPGALCTQTVAPDASAIAGAHGALTIDRSTSPATYVATGEISWLVTWTCELDDGTRDTMTFPAGGTWLQASGTVDATGIHGTRVQPDGTQCGRGDSATPCTYEWSFAPAP